MSVVQFYICPMSSLVSTTIPTTATLARCNSPLKDPKGICLSIFLRFRRSGKSVF